MIIRRQHPVLSLLLAALGILATAPAAAELEISTPWIREAPPAARVMAGYMKIHNTGTAAVRIIAVTSPDFARAELHRTVVEDGIARMAPVGELEVAAGSSMALEPGGLHLMLYEPEQALQEGDTVVLIMHRADGMCMTVQAPVQRDTSSGQAHQHHHQPH